MFEALLQFLVIVNITIQDRGDDIGFIVVAGGIRGCVIVQGVAVLLIDDAVGCPARVGAYVGGGAGVCEGFQKNPVIADCGSKGGYIVPQFADFFRHFKGEGQHRWFFSPGHR